MPSYLVTTMRAAVKWSALSGYVKSQIRFEGNPVGYLNPALVKSSFLKALVLAPKIGSFLGYR